MHKGKDYKEDVKKLLETPIKIALWIAGGILYLTVLWILRSVLTEYARWINLGGVLIALLCLLLVFKKKGRASGGGTHETGHRAGSGTGLLAALIILVAAGVVYLGKTEEDRQMVLDRRLAKIQLGGTGGAPGGELGERQHYFINVGFDEVAIAVADRMVCDTDPVHTNEVVWVRWEGEREFKDWKGRPSGGTINHFGHYKYLRSAQPAGSAPVQVEVSMYPKQ